MLKNFLNLYFIFFFAVTSSQASDAILKLPNDRSLVMNEYLKIHKDFSREMCKPGLENKYFSLLRDYRGDGYYLPELNEHIDVATIKKYIPIMKLKRKWVSNIYKSLKKMKTWPYYKAIANNLEESVELALSLKKRHFLEISAPKKEQLRIESAKVIELIKRNFDQMINKILFLISFQFPVDHLMNRKNYADLKESSKLEDKRKANEIFFLRRILEDGAMDANNTRSDKFLRSTLDTLSLNIVKMTDFLDENIRYDLDFVLSAINDQLKRGREAQKERFAAWEQRELKGLLFYNKIIQNENSKSIDKKHENDELMKKTLVANNILKDFVHQNLAKTYHFWRKQHKRNKALFVLETILYNEVGIVDGEDGLERIAVSKVVRNRVFDSFYRTIPQGQDLYKYLLSEMSAAEIQEEHWLNVLFKEGEFSFTYFYISGVVKIFCQDMSSRGQYLRRKNLWIAMDTLDAGMDNFDAVRYFSRASMNGRIDMSSVWSEFTPMQERPGLIHSNQNRMKRIYLSDNYQYLYDFQYENKVYQVLKISDQTIVMNWENKEPVFYKYRNPHYFKYFHLKSANN